MIHGIFWTFRMPEKVRRWNPQLEDPRWREDDDLFDEDLPVEPLEAMVMKHGLHQNVIGCCNVLELFEKE